MSAIQRQPARTATAGWRSIGELMAVLVGSWPGVEAPPLLSDTDPDPGLFGPDSATWLVAREPLLLLGGGRALLMQVADPLVGQAVVEHSGYTTDPFGRLVRTVRWLVAVTFGTTAEAQRATAAVQAGHRPVRGRLDAANAGGRLVAGTPYSADDADLAAWVHATIVQSMLVSREALVGPLERHQRDALVREWQVVGVMFGVAADALWDDAGSLDRWISDRCAALPPAPPASVAAARVVLRPPLPSRVLRPAFAGVAFLTAGLLDEPMRRGFGVRWTAAHQRAHNAACAGLRGVHPMLPRPLRISPLHDAALARTQGHGLRRKPPRRAMVVP